MQCALLVLHRDLVGFVGSLGVHCQFPKIIKFPCHVTGMRCDTVEKAITMICTVVTRIDLCRNGLTLKTMICIKSCNPMKFMIRVFTSVRLLSCVSEYRYAFYESAQHTTVSIETELADKGELFSFEEDDRG
jgi:hypothetical protein